MVRNSAHDSICACSADEVVDAVLHRYAEARQIGDGLTEQALAGRRPLDGRAPARWWSTPPPGTAPAWSRWSSPPWASAGPDVQVLSERAGLPGSITLDGETVRSMLGLLQGARIDDQAYVTDVTPGRGRDRARRHHGHRAPSPATGSPSRRSSGSSTPG